MLVEGYKADEGEMWNANSGGGGGLVYRVGSAWGDLPLEVVAVVTALLPRRVREKAVTPRWQLEILHFYIKNAWWTSEINGK